MKLFPAQLKPLLSHYSVSSPMNWKDIYSNNNPVNVEIGFGYGEYLLDQADKNPDQNYFGVEIIWERLARTLNHITYKKEQVPHLQNVRVMRCDIWIILERLIAQRSVNHFCSLFPCPWPKKKHIKHRLFSNEFLKLINSRLKENGTFMVVTDAKYFYDWILEGADDCGFKIKKKVIDPQYATKFEKKWLNEGQNKFFHVEFIKDEHIDVPVKEYVEMKSFKVSEFNPKTFKMENYTEEVAVICKEVLFDQKAQKANVHLIVSEDHLVQNIRVAIYKKQNYWRLCLAEGQDYFPTTGVNKALELVYAALS